MVFRYLFIAIIEFLFQLSQVILFIKKKSGLDVTEASEYHEIFVAVEKCGQAGVAIRTLVFCN